MGGRARPMERRTLFDLASLTKVVATTSCALCLADAGRLGLDDEVCTYVPEFRGGGRERVTVRALLTHTSGLPAEVKFWAGAAGPGATASDIARTPLEAPPGARVEYSDVGFMLLGQVLEAVTGCPLSAAVDELVTGPLEMGSTFFCPPPSEQSRVAATETGPGGEVIIGVVHDENARYFGGVMGHAGLFATVDDLVLYVQSWCGDGPGHIFGHWRPEACSLQTAGLDGRRGLGWVLRGDRFDFLDDSWPSTSVSHTGFTGTSLALDPVSGGWAVLLTNSVHFGRERGTIRPLRQRVHAAVAACRWS